MSRFDKEGWSGEDAQYFNTTASSVLTGYTISPTVFAMRMRNNSFYRIRGSLTYGVEELQMNALQKSVEGVDPSIKAALSSVDTYELFEASVGLGYSTPIFYRVHFVSDIGFGAGQKKHKTSSSVGTITVGEETEKTEVKSTSDKTDNYKTFSVKIGVSLGI